MEGIDISSYQGTIDWDLLKTDFIYIKMSQGVHAHDPKVIEYASAAQRLNIPFGYYHFASLNSTDVVDDANQEVADVANHLMSIPQAPLALALDIETNEDNLLPDQVELWINTFAQGIIRHDIKMVLYSDLYWLNKNLAFNHNLGWIGLWLAEYSKGLAPILPKGWADYIMWQYSSTGKVPGIQGNVDLNHAKKLIYNEPQTPSV